MSTGKRVAAAHGDSRRKAGGLSGKQKGLLALAAVLALLLLGTLAWKLLFVRPDVETGGGEAPPEEGTSALDYGEGVRPRSGGERKSEDYYTVLILGRDTGGGGNTDTMLLASYDVTNQKAAVMSIPRDTMVNVSWDVKKINSVYNACGQGQAGIDGLYREISQLVGFEPDFRVVVEWAAVGALVDAIGGVDFEVPYDMDYHDELQDLVIEQAAGERHLTGEDAMQVIRWRANDNTSPYGHRKRDGGVGDIGRMKIQQDFLKAVLRQLMTPANVLNIGPICRVFQENVETDLSFQNILWFGKAAVSGGLSLEDVELFTMPWETRNVYSRTESRRLGGWQELNYVLPKAGELLEVVNGKLSPFLEPFALKDLDIMSVNADGSLSSSTGRVEDRQAAQAPPSRTGAEEQPAEPGGAEQPAEPGGTEQPAEPGGTEQPAEPGGAEQPAEPGGAEQPTEPGGAEQPAEPGGAEQPAEPGGAEQPAEPGFVIVEPPPEAVGG